ncbi:MAG: hypothetical protein UHY90_04690 [Treponema sp.]|nr:hypothetical protein [Spirochaetia bacterium]MDD7458441.1 hypothetical protein [Spirochaetales bacterium]MDY5812644.1 hypothetical protein [Treponema sp.]MEE1181531.1 hypothetical protein [Treponema sp.]
MENLMDKEELLKLFRSRLARDFILSDYYEGKKYTFVGQSSKEETKSFGLTELTKRIVLVSDYEKMAAEKVKSAIEKLPVLALSGFRSIAKNKTTVLLRVFLMKQIPFELIQQVRSFSFEKSEQGAFNYLVNAGVILVDLSNNMLYSNFVAADFCHYFKIINPVEPKEELLPEQL